MLPIGFVPSSIPALKSEHLIAQTVTFENGVVAYVIGYNDVILDSCGHKSTVTFLLVISRKGIGRQMCKQGNNLWTVGKDGAISQEYQILLVY